MYYELCTTSCAQNRQLLSGILLQTRTAVRKCARRSSSACTGNSPGSLRVTWLRKSDAFFFKVEMSKESYALMDRDSVINIYFRFGMSYKDIMKSLTLQGIYHRHLNWMLTDCGGTIRELASTLLFSNCNALGVIMVTRGCVRNENIFS